MQPTIDDITTEIKKGNDNYFFLYRTMEDIKDFRRCVLGSIDTNTQLYKDFQSSIESIKNNIRGWAEEITGEEYINLVKLEDDLERIYNPAHTGK